MKENAVDKRINELMKAFQQFRSDNNMTMTETYMFLSILQLKVKNEIDNFKQKSFMQGAGFQSIMEQAMKSAENVLK